ncbi:MAG TPA: tetratricopeptide repeat protein [Gemmatimonadaceae bacterium]|jgi:tetratricopeptide (TPR) repeat protein|nr:tetratricopeptide repeat protein [Gemmatimonadaceae bacterium]
MMRRIALAIVGLVAGVAGAQSARREPIRQSTLTTKTQSSCAPIVMGAKAPSDEDRRRARDLAARGQQAAILGDSTAALNSLRQAAALDPTNADFAYQLGRVYEQSKSGANAAAEYCRFLVLAPNALEAAEVRDRILTIIPPRADPASAAAQREFQLGTSAYDAGRFLEAELHFSGALKGDSTWADAYYDRALVRVALAQRVNAMNDFERYLRFKPEATDRLQVVARIDRLRRAQLSQSQALVLGLVVPGGGQMYTRRPVRGALLFGMAAVALGVGAQGKTTTSTIEQTGTDPFGHRYTFTTTRSIKEHPYLAPGIIAAGGIAIVSAVEAFRYAGRVNTGAERLSFFVAPGPDRVVARFEFR